MQDTVDNRVIKRRSQILHNLNIKLGLKYRQQFVGETTEILVENNNGQPCGRSERYFMVYLEKAGEKLGNNELVKVKLIKNSENGAIGQPLTKGEFEL